MSYSACVFGATGRAFVYFFSFDGQYWRTLFQIKSNARMHNDPALFGSGSATHRFTSQNGDVSIDAFRKRVSWANFPREWLRLTQRSRQKNLAEVCCRLSINQGVYMSQEASKGASSSVSFVAKCLGIAILIVAGAGAYRVATGHSAFKIIGNTKGFEIMLEEAKEELRQASAEVSKAQDQVKAQSEELEAASNALAEREGRLNGLVAQLQQQTTSAPTVTPEVRSGLSELNRARATDLVKVGPPVDAKTFSTVNERLLRVENLSKQLNR